MDNQTVEAIEVRVTEIAQLFHTLDPFPFRERDLDREAEEFIVGWARELPADKAIKIVVHFPNDPAQIAASAHLAEALPGFFLGKATRLHGEMKELFRLGRRALLTGAVILAACLVCAYFVGGLLIDSPFKRLVEESFLKPSKINCQSSARACRHLSQTSVQTKCSPARKFRAVFS